MSTFPKASSAVLSLNDLVFKGKTNQLSTAADALCKYAEKYDSLVAVGKLVSVNGHDFGADAADIADDLVADACD